MRDDGFAVAEAMVTPRIGIKEAVDWPLRFAVPGHGCVSGPKSFTGRRVRYPRVKFNVRAGSEQPLIRRTGSNHSLIREEPCA